MRAAYVSQSRPRAVSRYRSVHASLPSFLVPSPTDEHAGTGLFKVMSKRCIDTDDLTYLQRRPMPVPFKHATRVVRELPGCSSETTSSAEADKRVAFITETDNDDESTRNIILTVDGLCFSLNRNVHGFHRNGSKAPSFNFDTKCLLKTLGP